VILETAVATALATGALGGAHCAAMCGPLAVAGCSRGAAGVAAGDAAGYFAGRLVAYATVGAVMGHLGHHALCILPMSALEGIATLAVGAAAAYRGFSLLRRERAGGQLSTLHPKRARARKTAAVLASLWPRRGLGLGVATAILPCGLLVPAWALAAGTGSAPAGALIMAALSAATLPGLVVPLLGQRLLRRAAKMLPQRAYGLAWCALAAWIAARPLLLAAGACHR
jgi:sulfite exporter TauE/SafE